MKHVRWSLLVALVAITTLANAATIVNTATTTDQDKHTISKEVECDIQDDSLKMFVDTDDQTCEDKHCFKTKEDGTSECYRKRTDPCYSPKEADRIYLTYEQSHECQESSSCHEPNPGIFANRHCYLKKTDLCFIPEKNRTSIQTYSEDVETACLLADGCYDVVKDTCYMKDAQCLLMPENCALDVLTSPCDKETGVGVQVEQWRCCPIGSTSCSDDRAHTVVVDRQCCNIPNPATELLVLDDAEEEELTEEDINNILNSVGAPLAIYHNQNIEKRISIIRQMSANHLSVLRKMPTLISVKSEDPTEKEKFWPCSQVKTEDDTCKENNFHKIERTARPDAQGYPRRAYETVQQNANLYAGAL